MADLSDPSWVQAVGGPFDGVVSAIAIHNLRDPDVIARIYADIFTVVKPGGANLELVLPGDMARSANTKAGLVVEQWRRFEQTGNRPSLEELAAEQTERRFARPAGQRARRPRPGLLDQLGWLRAAGFDEVECFWRDVTNALIGGYRIA